MRITLETRGERMLDVLRKRGPLTVGEAAHALGWSYSQAYDTLQYLRTRGRIKVQSEPGGRNRKYLAAGGRSSEEGIAIAGPCLYPGYRWFEIRWY